MVGGITDFRALFYGCGESSHRAGNVRRREAPCARRRDALQEMGLTYRRASCSLLLSLLRFWLFMSARALQMIEKDAPEITCTEGLKDCLVSSRSNTLNTDCQSDTDDTVNVTHLQLKVILCCSAANDCEPCLQIIITVQEVNNAKDISEQSGEHDNDDLVVITQMAEGSGQFGHPEAEVLNVKVYFSSPYFTDFCKTLTFKPSYSSLDQASQPPTHKLQLTEKEVSGLVQVHIYGHSNSTDLVQNITIPSLVDVCRMNPKWAEKYCDAPRLRAVTDYENNVVRLQLENTYVRQDELICLMVWNETSGEQLTWPIGEREIVISSNLVAPCLCFQMWWNLSFRQIRQTSCPFKNQTDALERMQHNVSVSMVESQMREGGTGLSWNVTAPCSLEAEVWLCKKDLIGAECEEVSGSRQKLHNSGWSSTRNGLWVTFQKTGEFTVSSHPLLCVQIKIHGIESYSEPQCPFATTRWRWSLPLVIGLILMCLAFLGAYFVQGVLKGHVWRWLKEDDVKGAVGGGHVVLLYPPGDNLALPEVMNHLGTSLQALGFSVSLDLWSQAELSILGPVPWLHSRLNRLQKQGGKVVLVLTQAAWIRAEEWGAQSCERNTPRDMTKKEAGGSYVTSSPCADVFTASLSCVLADYLQGRAGERFLLVQFESLPPEPPGGFRPLPELFRGLHVYSLPSQSLGFLTELAGARQMATASARRKRAGGLRMASRALARGLSGFTAGTSVLRLAGVTQSCVGVGGEDSGETVPLQPCLLTPPSSPDTNLKIKEMDWV